MGQGHSNNNMGQGHSKSIVHDDVDLRWEENRPSGFEAHSRLFCQTCEILPGGKRLMVIGGSRYNDFYYMIELEKNAWRRKNSPFKILNHTSCQIQTSPSECLILVFGGQNERYDYTSDLYECEVNEEDEKWKLVNTGSEKPIGRTSHSSVLSPDNKFMFVFGGFSSCFTFMNDLWKYDISKRTWEEIKPSDGIYPPVRDLHSAVTLRKENRMIISGGWNGKSLNSHLSDFWSYDFRTNKWTEIKYKNQEKIIPRAIHQMIVLRNENDIELGVILGPGRYSDNIDLSKHKKEEFSSLWYLDLSNRKWSLLSSSTVNEKVFAGYSMLQNNNMILILGGMHYYLPHEVKGKTFKGCMTSNNDPSRVTMLKSITTSKKNLWWEDRFFDPDLRDRIHFLIEKCYLFQLLPSECCINISKVCKSL